MTSTDLPQLVGETAEAVSRAEARRAELLPELLRVMETYKDPLDRRGERLAIPGANERARVAGRLREANRADWWLAVEDSSDERRYWSGVNPFRFGMPRDSWLPADFYSERKIAARQAETERAKAEAAFLGLPKLRGTEKQVAWAQTIRHKRLQEAGSDAERLLAIAGAEAARFWIDTREIEIDDLLTEEYAANAVEMKEQRIAGLRRKYGRKRG